MAQAGSKEMTWAPERYRFAGLMAALLTFVAVWTAIKEYGLPESGLRFAALRSLLCWAFLVAIGGFASSSFLVIMALYELLIRRVHLLRFLFGMKMLPRPQPVSAPQPLSLA
jgi:hypothetical protein